MKKTWTKRILIGLMTLALAIGVCIVAPKEAQAAVTVTALDPASVSQTIVAGGSINQITLQAASATGATSYSWSIINGHLPTGLTAAGETTQNAYTISGSIASTGTYTFSAFVRASDGTHDLEVGQIQIKIQVNPANTAPTDVTVPSLTGLKVGEAFSASCSASGAFPESCTYTASGLPAGLSISSGGVISGTPTTAGNGTCSVTATNAVGPYEKTPVSYTVAANKPTLTISGAGAVSIGETITLTANGVPDGAGGSYVWKDGATTLTSTSKTCPFVATTTTTTGDHTIEVSWTAPSGGNYTSSDAVTGTVTVNPKKATVSILQPSNGANYTPGSTILLVGSSDGAGCQWTVANGTNAITNSTNLTGASYVVSNSDIGKTLTFTLTSPTTGVTSKSVSVNIYVYNDDSVTNPSSNYSMTFNSTTLYDTQTFNVTTNRGGNVRITNSNPAIATVTAGGQTVGTSGVTVASGTQVSVKAVAYGRTYIDIVPENGSASNGKRITVHVGTATPTLDVQFWSSDNCTTTLTKLYNWGTLKVTVDNYNPQYPYVTITRANIRTYVQGGSYYSHPSTYTYTAALTQDLSDPLKATATLYVIPQYNGSTYYTAAYTGAVSKNSPTIYVTGYTTLPQTGPNYTWAYVLGGLCLASVATAVTLNVRKKKRESI